MNGVLIIDKPSGLTSHDVIASVRRIVRERRVGHTGTLDPFATGVLVVLVGRATRLAQFLGDATKEYEAIIRLGFMTDTGDRTGKLIEGPPGTVRRWTEEEVEAALAGLRGNIQQIPPMYSAKKVGGSKLYELARRGETIERQPVNICIHEFTPLKPDGELMKNNLDGTYDFHARVVCSSGTYVRTLAEDFGKLLGVGAHVAELRRTGVGDFRIGQSVTLDDLKVQAGEEALGTVLLSPESALSHLPFVHLSDEDERRVRHGMEVKVGDVQWSDASDVRMCDHEGRLLAVGKFDSSSGRLRPRVVIASD